MRVLVQLEARIAVALALKLDALRTDALGEIIGVPTRERRPVGHFVGQDDGSVGGVIAFEKFLGRADGRSSSRAIGEYKLVLSLVVY